MVQNRPGEVTSVSSPIKPWKSFLYTQERHIQYFLDMSFVYEFPHGVNVKRVRVTHHNILHFYYAPLLMPKC